MKTVLLLFIISPIISFSQENFLEDSIRKINNIASMTEIRLYYNADSIIRTDTIRDSKVFNREGKIIEEKYQIGAHVLHKYFYDSNSQIIQEIRLTSTSHKDVFTRPEKYTDTMTIINYH